MGGRSGTKGVGVPDPGSRAEVTPVASLAEVYRAHHKFVWRSLLRLGIPEARVEDAVHELFLVVARKLPEFAGRSSLRTWLFAIALRVAQSFRRDAGRERRHLERLEHEPRSDASEPYGRRDAAAVLHALLATLDDDKRAVYIMVELEGMTAPEIAEALGVKLPTVYTRLRAARLAMERAAEEMSAPRRSP